MRLHPLINKLLCVALVACLMIPAGQVLFPYLSHVLDGLQFKALEAVVSAALGFGIYAAMFG